MAKNKHGLSRYIPRSAKRKIRELCGFGCVICGGIPYDYDHFETEFHECKEHDINDIVLLCNKHHREKNSIGTDVIKDYLQKNPPKNRKVTFDPSILTKDFKIIWPSIEISSINNNILVDDEEILQISLTGDPEEPVHINGVFYDDTGTKVCTVRKNEFSARHSDLYDITCEANTLRMVAKSGRPILVFRMEPKKLIIEELYFLKNNAFVIADQEKFIIGNGDHCGNFSNSKLINNNDGIVLKSGETPLCFSNNNFSDYEEEIVLFNMSKWELNSSYAKKAGIFFH